VNTAPPPKPKKRDQTMNVVFAIIVGLLIAGALIWTGLRSLKRSADPFAGLERPAAAEPSTSEGSRLIA
jgi:hypothetical protein